ncbi:drug/metabolite transporter, DME family [Pseudoalteromonas ulvae UL12]|uniref:DMT family transporter n=1 Tax=Pseudoalteromonas ulvae TaxID=107327 RepID=UPI00186B5F42|nr:EamA family transporter [Pseudoalteromonas ulvae]MBE0362430.1 drug/metabolite transporter, DME family [Pseudoalteromonas ulvae UL12]
MENHDRSFKGVIAIIIASFLWGTTGTVASYSPDVSSLAIGAFSMGVGGVLLVISARKRLFCDCKLLFKQPMVLLLGAASVAIYPLAFYSSMHLAGVATGTVVSIASAPFFAAMLERLLSKKNISRQWIVSFVIGVIGIVLLVLGREHSNDIGYGVHQQSIGVILGGIAGLTYAGYSWAAKHLMESGVHSKSSMSGLFGCAAVLLLPSLWFTGDNLFSSSTNTLVSLYMAIVPMFLGYLLFGFGLNFIDASKATLITLIEPLVATILAVFIIGERFKVIGWVGIALVSLCLLMQTIKPQSQLRLALKST